MGCEDGALNIFTLEDDRELGAKLDKEIESNPQDYPLLDPGQYPDAYDHLTRIRDEILDSGEVELKNEFDWEVHIIDDDETLNAFAAPGGYIYVYTGLLRYLDAEDHFAGVLGHEIAHADRRHGTQQLTQAYGVSALIGLILGKNPGLAAEIAASLTQMSFSREHEAEADEYSVYYLCETMYAADGAAGFFIKLEEEGGVDIPEFLSTHPSGEHRIEDIQMLAGDLGCSTKLAKDAQWNAFMASLP